MAFYQSIFHLYDYIFPFSPAQKDFVVSNLKSPEDATLLEVGCATGSLAHRLAQDCRHVTGIDAEKQMVILARENMKKYAHPAHIMELDMRSVGATFAPDHFDAVFSFGNTLVHLPSTAEIADLLRQFKAVLKNNGKLMLQIVNYDRILDQNILQLPTIENDRIRFERYYHYEAQQHAIAFATILTDKQTGACSRQQIRLYPLRKDELRRLLQGAGFTDLQWFGGFDWSPLTPETVPLIVTAA